jgi:hypothetical protein
LPTFWLQFLDAPTGHLHDVSVAERHVGFGETKVDQGIGWFELSSMCIGDCSFPAFTLTQRHFPLF